MSDFPVLFIVKTSQRFPNHDLDLHLWLSQILTFRFTSLWLETMH